MPLSLKLVFIGMLVTDDDILMLDCRQEPVAIFDLLLIGIVITRRAVVATLSPTGSYLERNNNHKRAF